MKLSFAFLSMAFAAASAKKIVRKEIGVDTAIPSTSALGKKILSKSRRLADDDNQEIDLSWMTSYDLKFQGCYETNSWNAEADGDEDVKIATKRLVRYRLCPSGSCDSDSASGCKNGYGDYLVDLNVFVDTWSEARMNKQEYECEQLRENCGCDGDDVDDEEGCEYNCYQKAGMSYCIDEEDEFNPQEYMECGEWEVPDDDDNNRRRRRLEDAEEEEVQYFIGPYCASQGGAIYFGMFTDETCTTAYDSYYGANFYKAATGSKLPYSSSSLVEFSCKSCIQEQYNQDERKLENEYMDANGNYAAEICVEPYMFASKCEQYVSGVDYPNNYGCNFIEGVKIIRTAGSTTTMDPQPSKSASAFIGIFAVSFCLLGGYVYYLKTKLDKAKINLAE